MKDQALYLEVDEDITSAIDKLTKTTSDTVQIVVPKRSTMLQSVINLKLLKKAAQDAGKELVLVTNDRVATDLASRVGLAVAPSLGAKPVLAEEVKVEPSSSEDIIEADEPDPVPSAAAKQALDPQPAKEAKPATKRPLFARKEVGEGPAAPAAAATAGEPAPDNTPSGGAMAGLRAPKIPNFGKLQRRLMWLGLAAVLVVGYFVAMWALTSAKVTLYASGNLVDVRVNFKADPGAKTSDVEAGLLAAQAVSVSKDQSADFTPTGKKDVGTKAGGNVTVKNCTTNPQPLTVNTRFVAPDGKVFRSTADTTVPAATYPVGVCIPGQSTVAVQAAENGDSYNEAPAAYTIPGLNNPAVTAQGGQMSGGTSKVVTVVTQEDVDKAKAELLAKDQDDALRSLAGKVDEDYVVLKGSEQATAEEVTASPAVGEEATSATLKLKAVHTQLAVLKKDYEQLVREAEQEQIGKDNQIYDDGLDGATVKPGAREADGRQAFELTTQASGGPRIDKEQLAKDIKGKKFGDAMTLARKVPGVQRAEIKLAPLWATNLPSRTSKITIDIQVAEAEDN